MRNRVKRALAGILIVILFISNLMVVQAKNKTVVRVAYCPIEGFFEDGGTTVFGYGVEVLKKAAEYCNARFVYVKAEDLEEAKELLDEGKVDIVAPVMKNSLFSGKKYYVGYVSMFESFFVVMAKKERNDLYFEDDATLRKINIGIAEATYGDAGVRAEIKEMKIPEKHIKVYEKPSEIKMALKQGEVDAVITDITRMNREFKQIARFGYSGNYIVSRSDYEYIRVIEDAIGQIKIQEPAFLTELVEKYYPGIFRTPITKAEWDYLKKLEKLTFVAVADQGYYLHEEHGECKGIYRDIVEEVGKRLGIPCEIRCEDAQVLTNWLNRAEIPSVSLYDEEGLADNDVVMELFTDKRLENQLGVSITDGYISLHYYEIYRKGEEENRAEDSIAVVVGDRGVMNVIESFYTNKIVWCGDYQECLQKVRDGQADTTIIPTEVAEYYMPYYKNSSLALSFLDEETSASMAVKEETLAAILNKVLTEMQGDGTIKEIIDSAGMNSKSVQNGFLATIYNNPRQSIRIISTITVLSLIIFVLLIAVYRIRKKNEFLEKMSSAKTDFMSRMSHDIRTPMNAVLGMAHLARDEENVPEKVDEYLDKIEGAGEYLLGLINDILDMTKLQSGKIVFKYEVVDMLEIGATVRQLLLPTFNERNVGFIQDTSNIEYRYIKTDRMRMMQIISNLLSNAVKFTPPGKNVYWIAKSEKISGNRVETTTIIRDEGCGMSESFLKKLYEPFEQEDNPFSKGVNGTGLGLAIVKNLVDQMGGKIMVESKLSEGTTFTITFIRNSAEAFEKKSEITEKNIGSVYDNLSVLVVEDQPLNQEILQGLLEKKKVGVFIANNGQEAVDFMESPNGEKIQMVFMDIRMPVMDGIEAVRRIRQLPMDYARNIPIIALTANAFDDDKEATKQAGMNGHLAKPINPAELFETIEKFL